MKQNRTTIVDLGNFNIKYMGEDSEGMFSSKISNDYQSYPEGFKRLEMDGQITYISVGELSREFNKSNRDYIPQLLYAICKANKSLEIIETNLTLLLPIIQMENKTKLVENLKGKEFSIKFNGMDRIVNIQDVLVLPEGYSSYYSLSTEEKQGDLCLIDAGSRTINICVLENGKIQKLNTVKLGSFDFFSKLKSQQNSKGEDFSEEDICRLIDGNIIKVYQKQYDNFLNEILNSIKPYVNIKTYKTIFTGGTSLMLKESIDKLSLPNYKIHDNPLRSNVIGAKAASQMVWKVSAENGTK